MKILLIAPDQHDINQVPEIRTISSHHRTFVLNSTVTLNDVYRAAEQSMDVVHFATHIGDLESGDSVALSNGQLMNLHEIVQIIKISGSRLVIFNVCSAARLGNFIARHTNACAIYTTIRLQDDEAWKFPLAFYGSCARRESRQANPLNATDYYSIFVDIDDETGMYSWAPSRNYQQVVLAPLENRLMDHHELIERTADDVAKIGHHLTLMEEKMEKRLALVEDSAKATAERVQRIDEERQGLGPLWERGIVKIVVLVVLLASAVIILEAIGRLWQ